MEEGGAVEEGRMGESGGLPGPERGQEGTPPASYICTSRRPVSAAEPAGQCGSVIMGGTPCRAAAAVMSHPHVRYIPTEGGGRAGGTWESPRRAAVVRLRRAGPRQRPPNAA